MRRLDRSIEKIEDIIAVLDHCHICHLGMITPKGTPYVVPLNFGYTWNRDQLRLYMHCAKEGFKLDCLHANPSVCVVVSNASDLISGPHACNYSQKYESVMIFGRAEVFSAAGDKRLALEALMRHLTGQEGWDYDPASLDRVSVIRVSAESFTGKRHM